MVKAIILFNVHVLLLFLFYYETRCLITFPICYIVSLLIFVADCFWVDIKIQLTMQKLNIADL